MQANQMEEFKGLFIEILAMAEDRDPIAFKETLTQIDNNEGDEVDIITSEKANQLDLRLKSRETVYLRKIKYALDKIHTGTFGACEECEADIGIARLKARPTATLCVHCKEEEEQGENQLIHKNRHSHKWERREELASYKELTLISNG